MTLYFPESLKRYHPDFICFSTWTDHMPFGYDIVEAVKPKITTELGSQGGLSFFTFCQSIKENNIDGVAYAVDTWEGEEHTGKYDESTFESVQNYARQEYMGFAYLLRMLFNDALNHFEPETIDLLHIDGLHTYDAVKEDFENWYPKVKPGGVILFHDVYARIMDFGAWKFWQELAQEPNQKYSTFEFQHGFGLGVLQKPFDSNQTKADGNQNDHPLLKLLFEGSEEDHANLRKMYVHAAKHFEFQRKAANQEKQRLKRLANKQKNK